MSKLQRQPDVYCKQCNSEVRYVASAIKENGQLLSFQIACDCQVWSQNGRIPDAWVDSVKMGEKNE